MGPAGRHARPLIWLSRAPPGLPGLVQASCRTGFAAAAHRLLKRSCAAATVYTAAQSWQTCRGNAQQCGQLQKIEYEAPPSKNKKWLGVLEPAARRRREGI